MKIVVVVLMTLGTAQAAVTRPTLPSEAPPAAPSAPAGPAAVLPQPLRWLNDLDDALLDAAAHDRPVLALATSPDCRYCRQLKAVTLADADVVEQLRGFTLVELDVSRQPGLDVALRLQGLPTIIVLAADGRERRRHVGYLGRADMLDLLRASVGGSAAAPQDRAAPDVLDLLDQDTIPADQWPVLLAALGEPDVRPALQDWIRAGHALPRSRLVDLLQDPRLAVRLGALECLEPEAGGDFGFDPWWPDPDALEAWRQWAAGPATNAPTATALSRAQMDAYAQELVADDRQRCARAMRMLQQGGGGALQALQDLVASRPDLPPGARARIQEVRYALTMPELAGPDPSALAHRLVFGTLDGQLKALWEISRAGPAAVPILTEFLQHDEPLVRETAIEALLAASGAAAVPILSQHAARETDLDVTIAIIRGLGSSADPAAAPLLLAQLKHAHEDVVVAALQALVKLEYRGQPDAVARLLADPRWRVRAAALEAAEKMRLRECRAPVEALLQDEEAFVRFKAVSAYAAIQGKAAAPKLEALFLNDDALKGPVIAAYDSLELDLPDSFAAALAGQDAAVLLAVLQGLAEHGLKGLPLAAALATHANDDVACAALRLLASRGMSQSSYQAIVALALQGPSRARQLAVLQVVQPLNMRQSSYTSWSAWDRLAADAGASATGHLARLFAAFTVPDPPRAAAAPAADTSGSNAWMNAAHGLLQATDPELSLAAALALLRFHQEDALSIIDTRWDELSAVERHQVASGLGAVNTARARELMRKLLRDPVPDVRAAAVAAIYDVLDKEAWPALLFEELVATNTLLQAHEAWNSDLASAAQTPAGRRLFRQWSGDLLAQETRPALQSLGLLLLESSGDRTAVAKVQPYVRADSPWLRRAAGHAMARLDPVQWSATLTATANDPSEYVRAGVPAVLLANPPPWVHYFDEAHFGSVPGTAPDVFRRLAAGGDSRARLVAVLRTLARDPAPRVRFDAMMALLSRKERVAARELLAAITTHPDQETAGERVAAVMEKQYRDMPPDYVALLSYLAQGRISLDSRRAIEKHFRPAASLVPSATGSVVQARAASPGSSATGLVRLVYFMDPGCDDCARISVLLTNMVVTVPGLGVETHDIGKRAAQILYDELAHNFQVPAVYRRLTPVIFAGAGWLVRDEVTQPRVIDLISRSRHIPPETWYPVLPPDPVQTATPTPIPDATPPPASVTTSGWLLVGGVVAGGAVLVLLGWWTTRRHAPAAR